MKKCIAYLLLLCMLFSTVQIPAVAESDVETKALEAAIREELAQSLDADEYEIDVRTYYLSREYLEDMAFRNRQSSWYGYYLADVDAAMGGRKWVFTVEDGQTVYREFEPYDDTYDVALQNLAVGTGVIVVCVTISVVSGGLGAPVVSAVFACSATQAALHGVSSGLISGAISGVTTAIETGSDVDAVMKSIAKNGSEAFMWSAIEGAVTGAVTETIHQVVSLTPLSKLDIADIKRKMGWSDDVISQIASVEEAEVYQNAGLKEVIVNNRRMLVRTDIDLNYENKLGDTVLTNLERMRKGYAPIDKVTGEVIQLHHVNQEPYGILAMLTGSEHQGNAEILNRAGKEGVQKLLKNTWNSERKEIWKAFADIAGDLK